jgi:hypothetical protein
MREVGAGGPLGRVLRAVGGSAMLDLLGERLSGADLTTLLLEVVRRRAGRLSAADVMRQYERDRFVVPGPVALARLREVERRLLAALPSEFELIALSPLAPLGAHSALATVDQNRVVTTVRGSEVAADPTNGLALEAARRRRLLLHEDSRSHVPVRLAATQRVVRAQAFDGPGLLAHFEQLGLVTAGRDIGNDWFETTHALEHIRVLATAVRALGADTVEVALTTLAPSLARAAATIASAVSMLDGVRVIDPVVDGGSYYGRLRFKIYGTFAGERAEVGDGGLVNWTQRLVGSRKERLVISGLGIDRIATLST